MFAKETQEIREDEPNEFGEMSFNFKIKPVSQQAIRSKKDEVTNAIQKVTKNLKYLLSGDVAIEIVWHINEDERYESDANADVDNIIKPILDALSGPLGIIINDSQVQFISTQWVSRYEDDEQFDITIKYEPDAWYEKKCLVFVQLNKTLCMPLKGNLPKDDTSIFLNVFEMQLSAREAIIKKGGNYYMAQSVMSIQRIFHKTRLNGFKIIGLKELRAQLVK
jgi:Holliday junction resolvase RusA-like endonuclease